MRVTLFKAAFRFGAPDTGTSLNIARLLLVPEHKFGHRAYARALTPEVVLGPVPGHGH